MESKSDYVTIGQEVRLPNLATRDNTFKVKRIAKYILEEQASEETDDLEHKSGDNTPNNTSI